MITEYTFFVKKKMKFIRLCIFINNKFYHDEKIFF